jgi:hypothetical protein
LLARYFFPFLKIGITFARRQSVGTSPFVIDVLKMVVRCGANSAANCFNIRARIWSGPVAFVGSRFLRSFSVPNMVTFISGID